MKTNNSKTKAFALRKTRAAALIIAALLAALLFTGCPQKAPEPPAPPPTYAVTFSVDGSAPNGTLSAQVDGGEIASGKEVEHGKWVIFTAKANDGYRVKGWTLDGNAVNGTAETYTLAVTQPATVTVSFEIQNVILTVDAGHKAIKVRAVTEDGSAITVEGCNKTTLASEAEFTLTATGTTVILKGKITKLYCSGNKLTELNVQGCAALQKLYCSGNQLPELNVQGLTALQELSCGGNKLTELNVQGLTALQELSCGGNKLTELNVQGLTALKGLGCFKNQLTSLNVQDCTSLRRLYCTENKLNAQAMTEILKALPSRTAGDNAKATLYTEKTGVEEGNCKDYSTPEDLKKAFDEAKSRNWKLKKLNASGSDVDI